MHVENILETERLRLRKPSINDAETIFHSYGKDPEVSKFMNWPTHTSVQDALSFLQKVEEEWASGKPDQWIIEQKSDSQVIGMISGGVIPPVSMIGYVIAKPFWGKGYVTEATKRMIDYVFSIPDMHRVEALCYVNNIGSYKVMEKSGMQREGMLRKKYIFPNLSDVPQDIYWYGMTRDEWINN